ncbi:22008_t:CDS:2 [Entrophospora sp. SA101]|nr:5222_t:CDS:2 [Entrophospora sp. SA101]CAJ0750859.1 22008_t:CDS:2 [Entrophospora sp. SA101]CAJ0921921.1 19375_t:CDS:2 [Entrophospora sp. SA101]
MPSSSNGDVESSTTSNSSSSAGNLLNRRQNPPLKLNLTIKNRKNSTSSNGQSSLKDSNNNKSTNSSTATNSANITSGPSTTTSTTNNNARINSSTPPLMSPKIIELRRSESFSSNKSSKSSDDSSSSSTVNSSQPNNKKKPKSSKSLATTTETAAATTGTETLVLNGIAPKGRSHFNTNRNLVKKSKGAKNVSNRVSPKDEINKELLARLEEQNSQLPPQDSTQFLLARLERQNELLDNDPKSVCIESNVLKANLETVQSLIDDITTIESTKTIDWDFWTALIQDYNSVATKLPHLLTAKLQQGLPPKLRGLIWQSMSQASSTYLETMYSQLLNESSPYDRIIQRDLARTFPTIEMFKKENGKGQTMLWNVLKAYSLYDPLVGYCQGLGFLVGPLVMNMNETQAFCVFVRLMETYDMRTMFTLNMEGLQLRLYQFSALLSQILPNLHAHFHLHGVNVGMFASQWFLSLFAYSYPFPLVLRIYDVAFAEGAPETIMRVAVALLKKNEETLNSLGEFEDLLDFLTSRLYDAYNNEPTGLIKDAMSLSSVITKSKLDHLSENYVKDLEDSKKRAEELVAVRFNSRFGRNSSSTNKKDKRKKAIEGDNTANKRDGNKPKRWSLPNTRNSIQSFVNYATSSSSSNNNSLNKDSDDNNNDDNNSQTNPATPTAASFFSVNNPSQPQPLTSSTNVGILHQQIEDLVLALSQLQKDHVDLTDQLVNIKMEKMDLINELEGYKLRVKGIEKENKRMSSLSVLSINSDATLNDDTTNTSDSNGPLTPPKPNLDFISDSINDINNHKTIKRRASLPTTVFQQDIIGGAVIADEKQHFNLFNNNNLNSKNLSLSVKLNNNGIFNAGKNSNQFPYKFISTQELNQLKEEKYVLMQENEMLVKKILELEDNLDKSFKVNKKLQDKNSFFRDEIKRLDEENAEVIYEKNAMLENVKGVKELRIQLNKVKRENEKLKKEIEENGIVLMLSPGICDDSNNGNGATGNCVEYDEDGVQGLGEDFDLTTFKQELKEELLNTSINKSKSFRRVSFMSFFGSCESTKKVSELEKSLKNIKILLLESEDAREDMSHQLEELSSLIYGFDDIGFDMV